MRSPTVRAYLRTAGARPCPHAASPGPRRARVLGAPAAAVRLARSLGFHSTIVLTPGQRIVLDERLALTGIRPRFPYGMGSIGMLIESLEDGVRTYFEPHVAPLRHPLLEPAVDVIIAPVQKVRLAGVQLAMDVDECVRLARHLKARWLLATDAAAGHPAGATAAGGRRPRHLRGGDPAPARRRPRPPARSGEVIRVPPRRRRSRPAA
ncbi:MAG: MBL fold metallo-hydrolase [Gammaproteobacteria bacterium]|nr:MBL fold metallo-hydrolase [Gammaproteobacteria bacterium]